MEAIPNPEFPAWDVLRTMLLISGGIIGFLLVMTLVLAILTFVVRLLFIPRTRWNIYNNGVEEFEKLGFKTLAKRR